MGNVMFYNIEGYEEAVRSRKDYKEIKVDLPAKEMRSLGQIEWSSRVWMKFLHPRREEYWHESKDVYEVLRLLRCLAKGCKKDEDPIFTFDRDKCVEWYGDKCPVSNIPILYVYHPGSTVCTPTAINRLLTFLFADEETINILKDKRKKALVMACGNTSCINLSHISVEDE